MLKIRIPLPGGKKKTFATGSEFTLGRDGSNDWSVPDLKTISRQHMKVKVGEVRIFITDLGSQNGTFIGGEKAVPNQEYPVELDGHTDICVGTYPLVFVDADDYWDILLHPFRHVPDRPEPASSIHEANFLINVQCRSRMNFCRTVSVASSKRIGVVSHRIVAMGLPEREQRMTERSSKWPSTLLDSWLLADTRPAMCVEGTVQSHVNMLPY